MLQRHSVDFFETVQKRRSVRIFKPVTVPEHIIEKAMDAALMAPNTSNIQPWEFYWVKNESKKKELVVACLSQLAAKNAADLIVAVARADKWKRNSALVVSELKKQPHLPLSAVNYYTKLLPLVYTQGPFGIFGLLKAIFQWLSSFFWVVPDMVTSRSELFKVFVKSTALACENFMLAIVSQGYACCPMEGFNSRRIKKILDLNSNSEIVMVIAVGVPDPKGIYGDQIRLDRSLFFHIVT